MNILAIASIVPVPGIYPENDVIFRMYSHYRKNFPGDSVSIWRPSVYSNAAFASVKEKWNTFHRILKQGDYSYDDFRIGVLPFLDRKTSPGELIILARSLWWFNRRRISRELAITRPDVIHAHRLFPDGWLALKMHRTFGIPYVLTLRRETEFLTDPKSRKAALEIVEHAGAITVLNVRMRDALKRHAPHLAVQMLPHGIEDAFFEARAIPDSARSTGPAIITLSRFMKEKYLDRLISALGKVAERNRFTYTLIGSGSEEDRVRQAIRESGIGDRITLRDPIPYEAVPEILANHDIFALTSFPESFGRSYFEAMAVGLPVICSRNSGIDGFSEHEEAGLLVDHESIEDIAKALERLIGDSKLRRRLGDRGRDLVSQYRWPNIVESYHRLYRQAID